LSLWDCFFGRSLDTASSFGSRPKVESSIDGEIVVILTEDAYKLAASYKEK
jgi:hypothetical protein